MNQRLLLWTTTAMITFACSDIRAAEAPANDATAEAQRLEAQHAYRIEVTEAGKQDPVVFTDISPYTTDEAPVRLPPDQSLE